MRRNKIVFVLFTLVMLIAAVVPVSAQEPFVPNVGPRLIGRADGFSAGQNLDVRVVVTIKACPGLPSAFVGTQSVTVGQIQTWYWGETWNGQFWGMMYGKRDPSSLKGYVVFTVPMDNPYTPELEGLGYAICGHVESRIQFWQAGRMYLDQVVTYSDAFIWNVEGVAINANVFEVPDRVWSPRGLPKRTGGPLPH